MKQTRQDFFTANGEGIKIMTFTEFARHILRMECGESLGLYAVVNRQTRECSRPLSVRKEQWNGTPFYLLGGHGQEVRTINFAGRPKEEFETTCHDALDSYDAVESIGAVVSRLRELSPEELHKRIAEEMKTGCKYLLVYRSEEEMTTALSARYTLSAIRTANSFSTCISRIISIWKTGAILWTPHPFRTCTSIPIGQSPTPRYATRCSPPGW